MTLPRIIYEFMGRFWYRSKYNLIRRPEGSGSQLCTTIKIFSNFHNQEIGQTGVSIQRTVRSDASVNTLSLIQ